MGAAAGDRGANAQPSRPTSIRPSDVVIGALPVHLVAEVCARGGRYLHLTMNVPPEARGRELTADDMKQFGARLEEYKVREVK